MWVRDQKDLEQAVDNSSHTKISYTTQKDTQNTPGMDPVIAMY